MYIPETQGPEGKEHIIGHDLVPELDIEGTGCAHTGIGTFRTGFFRGHEFDGIPGAGANAFAAPDTGPHNMGQTILLHPNGPCGACLHTKDTAVAQTFADFNNLDRPTFFQGFSHYLFLPETAF